MRGMRAGASPEPKARHRNHGLRFVNATTVDARCAWSPPEDADQALPMAQAPQIYGSDPGVRQSALPDAPLVPIARKRAPVGAVPAHGANVRRPGRRGAPPAPTRSRRGSGQTDPGSISFGPGPLDHFHKAPAGHPG